MPSSSAQRARGPKSKRQECPGPTSTPRYFDFDIRLRTDILKLELLFVETAGPPVVATRNFLTALESQTRAVMKNEFDSAEAVMASKQKLSSEVGDEMAAVNRRLEAESLVTRYVNDKIKIACDKKSS